MRDLIDLIQIVTKPKLRAVELLSGTKKDTSRLQEFYDLIANGQLKSDEEAAKVLYNEDKQSPVYKKLRKNLKDRLVNALFVIDLNQSSYTDRQRAFYECYKEWAAAKILFGKNARNAAVRMALKIYKVSRHYEFTELNVDICHTLRLYYGTIEGDYARFQKHTEELRYLEALWLAENQSEDYYLELSIGAVHQKAAKTDNRSQAEQYLEQLAPSLEKFDSYQLHLCARLIEAGIYSSVNDYEALIGVCDRAIGFFEKKAYTASVPLQVFHYQKAICAIQLDRIDEAAHCLVESQQYAEEGSFNWFKAHELSLMILLRQKRYGPAVDLLSTVMGHPAFEDLPENVQAIWKTSEAYLDFLLQIGKLPHKGTTGRTFRFSKFVNDMQVFAKDKQGMNLHLIIIEILSYLSSKQTDTLIERAEALDKYRLRYLQSDEVRRSNYFLKMLLQIPKCAFRKDEILKKTAQDFEGLSAIPIKMANQTLEIEILPYDSIWTYVLDVLD